MKADILRRAEEISDDEDDEDGAAGGKALAFEDELDDEGAVKVRDGDVTDEAEGEVDEDAEGGTGVSVSAMDNFCVRYLFTKSRVDPAQPGSPPRACVHRRPCAV